MTETSHVYNVPDWYKQCREKGLRDIKFLIPVSVEDRKILGFSNTSQASIVCFYKDNLVTYLGQWALGMILHHIWHTRKGYLMNMITYHRSY